MNRYRCWNTLRRQVRSELIRKRWYSKYLAHEIPFERLAHQCVFAFDIKMSQKANLIIHPTLEDTARKFQIRPLDYSSDQDDTTDIIYYAETQESDLLIQKVDISCPATTRSHEINVHLTPNIDLIVSILSGQVEILNKVEGNISIAVGDGDVSVHKIRGDNVQMKTNHGCIKIANVVEGVDVQLGASQIICKRLLAENCDVRLLKGRHASEFGAIYGTATRIHSLSKGLLSIGNVHGYMRVLGEAMDALDIVSVNGALEVEDTGGNCCATVHFDSCSPGAKSSIMVGGDIQVSLNPNTPIDVEIHGARIETPNCEFIEHTTEQLDDDYAILTGRLTALSQPKNCSVTSGKINVDTRRDLALQTSFFANRGDNQNSDEINRHSDLSALSNPSDFKLLLHSPCGIVRLQQFDWMKRISNRVNSKL